MDTDALQDGGRPWRARRDDAGDHAGYAALAPSVDRDWVEGFVLEQRLLGVPGDRIGDALVLIESHIVEAGEPVREAFGDARAYARQSAPVQRVSETRDPRWLLGTGCGLAGMLLTGIGANEWLFGAGTIDVTLGLLLTGALVLVAFAVLALAPGAVLRLAVEHIWLFAGVLVALTAVFVVLGLVLDSTVAVWPAGLVAGVGVVLLILGVVFTWVGQARGVVDDPIVGPHQQARSPEDRSRAGWDVIAQWLLVFQFPVLTLFVIGLGWVLHLLS
jgi:hypothetical protein